MQSESGSFNNLNQLLGLNEGTEKLKVAGYLDKSDTVTVNGQSAAVAGIGRNNSEQETTSLVKICQNC